jgi:hypothetical protein
MRAKVRRPGRPDENKTPWKHPFDEELDTRWRERCCAAYFIDTSPRSGSKWGMLALIVKAFPGSACGLEGHAYV